MAGIGAEREWLRHVAQDWRDRMTATAVTTANLVRVGRLDEIESPTVVSGGRHGISVFISEGRPYAVDNRCPHMGFPLHKGS